MTTVEIPESLDAEEVPASHYMDLEFFFKQMYDSSKMIDDLLESGCETTVLDLPPSTYTPPGSDAWLYQAMGSIGKWPEPEKVQIAKLLAGGRIAELLFRVDVFLGKGRKQRKTKSILGIQSTVIPDGKTVWLCDATTTHEDAESMTGRTVIDETPKGEIEIQHPLVQVPHDITKGTGKEKFISIFKLLLARLPFRRFGIISHREHVATINSSPSLSANDRSRIARMDYFRSGSSRGSNEWLQECDAMLILGTPRVPPSAIQNKLVAIGLSAATARPETWTKWGHDYWSGVTLDGRRMTIRTLAYRDHDWHRAHRSIVRAELIQAAGRGRAVCSNGIPAIVVATEDLGIPLLDLGDEFFDSDCQAVVDAVKKLAVSDDDSESADRTLPLYYYLGEVSDNDCSQVVISPIAKVSDNSSPVSTAAIANEIGKSERQTQRILTRLERLGFLARVGERGGWLPSAPEPIDLYLAAGITPRVPVTDPGEL